MLAYILTQIGGSFEEENQLIRFVVSFSIDSEFSDNKCGSKEKHIEDKSKQIKEYGDDIPSYEKRKVQTI